MSYAPSETWELESIFAGGPGGAAFGAEAVGLGARIAELTVRADALPPGDLDALAALLVELAATTDGLDQLASYGACIAAADAGGKDARRAEAIGNDLAARYGRAWVVPNERVTRLSDAELEQLLARPGLSEMRGMLLEKRRLERLRLPEREEALAAELQRDGLIGWGELYDEEAGAVRLTFDRGAGPETVSPGQIAPLIGADDKGLRDRAASALQEAWRPLGPRCARILTHITGTRITLNTRRGLDILDEPCANAKIERSTLDAMIEACRRARPMMHEYLAAKARACGQASLSWADTFAPIGTADGKVGYTDAQAFVVEQFDQFSPRLSGFARRALEGSWIEVEDRPGKRGGGFCCDMPLAQQSRIFMTWGGSGRSMSTLAHELGHAFHNEVLHGVPSVQRRVPMTLAETASTFAELLVREAAMARESDPGRRLRLVDASLADALAFLVNIPARFELEQALYTLREQGPLEAEAVEARCVEIFSEWYGPSVPQVDPTFWISKGHFYIPTLSFYNFPYAFGYLFSNLVYEHFRPLGADGAPGYERLLRRTGDEWAEPIAREELGLDLADPDTWVRAMGPVRRDLGAFSALTSGS